MIVILTFYLYTHIYCLLMFCFHESYLCLIGLECWLSCGFHILWKIICFIPYLKDFVLVNKTFYFKLVRILRFDNMSYTMLLLLFNWYHWTLSIGINFDLFVYSYVYCVCILSIGIIYWRLVLILFHTHTCFICAIIFLYLEHKSCFC